MRGGTQFLTHYVINSGSLELNEPALCNAREVTGPWSQAVTRQVLGRSVRWKLQATCSYETARHLHSSVKLGLSEDRREPTGTP
jgi:hypothetical protein